MTKTKTRFTPKAAKLENTANGTAMAPDVLTLEEAAAYLRVAAADVVRMIGAEDLPARKFGTQWRFYKAALQIWLSAPPAKRGLLGELGKIKDDPYMEEMLRDIYKRRGRPEVPEGKEA